MPSLVGFTKHGSIGVITVNNPPVNALSPGVPEGIEAALADGNGDAAVEALVLMGGGRTFIAGADIKQMDRGRGPPRRPPGKRLHDVLERSPKPVVAAIHGYALGGGLENALGCHYRIAAAGAKVGLPEVLIGIVPGGGGTQRLPRLIGPRRAMELIVSGRHVPAPEALELGLVDEVVDDEASLLEAALAFAARVAGHEPPRISERDDRLEEAKAHPGMFDEMRAKLARRARNQSAPLRCVDAVEAATQLPFLEGLGREREIFDGLVDADEAKSLRYAFFAEREAAKLPDLPKETPTVDIATAAVIGGGTMGGGIAMAFANAGLPVKLLEVDEAALDGAMARIRRTYEASVTRGRLAGEAVGEHMALIEPVLSYDDLGGADIVIEAVFEDLGLKEEVFARLDRVAPPQAVLATNSSGLDVDAIAAATKRPESVVGTHFFSPANVMKLVEIVRGAKTSGSTLASAMKLAKQLGKIGVACGNGDGFVANRSRVPFSTEINILIEEGAPPSRIDEVMVEFGYPMGPLAVADLAGGDIGYAGRRRRAATDPGYRALPIADRLVEMGRLGQKTNAGWYRYDEGARAPQPDPAVDALISDYQQEAGITPRPHPGGEILKRILLASVNEVCKILEEGIAYRASDVDVMWLAGFGFPRYRGGLMFWADQLGPRAVHDQLSAWEQELGLRWKPAGLLADLARSGKRFREA